MRTRLRRTVMIHGRRCVLRVAAALVAVVMLVGVLRAGASYVYCPSMQRVADAPCCSGDRAHHDVAAANDGAVAMQVRSRDCCEKHVVGQLPSAAAASTARHLFSASFVAVVPAPTVDPRASGSAALLRFDHEGRAGPIAAARHRAELMVSLN